MGIRMKNNRFDFIKKIFPKRNLNKDLLLHDVNELLISYRAEILSDLENLSRLDIKSMRNRIKKQMDPNLIIDLYLDSFFRGLYSVIVVPGDKAKHIDHYFDSYIENLPRRIERLFDKNIKDFRDDEEFDELKKLKQERRLKISKNYFKSEKVPLQIELLKMQEWIKRNDYKLALVFEGRDAAGKGSAITTMTEYMQPKYFTVEWFDIPTTKENKNWFKRYYDVMPQPGRITFFDRSWYNRAVNDPVMEYCSEKEYKKFMKDVVPFEEQLNKDGVHIIKCWFSISRDIQALRFKLRQANPLKYWKFSENDLKTMTRWEDFTTYKEKMFRETSTEKNPWVVVESNDKRLAQLHLMKYILREVPYDGKDLDNIGEPFSEIIIPMR